MLVMATACSDDDEGGCSSDSGDVMVGCSGGCYGWVNNDVSIDKVVMVAVVVVFVIFYGENCVGCCLA